MKLNTAKAKRRWRESATLVRRRGAQWSTLLMVCLSQSSCAFVTPSRPDDRDLIVAYSRAQCLFPVPKGEYGDSSRNWNHTIELADGLQVLVEAYCFVHGQATVRYSDDQETHVVVPSRFYVYPCDIRVDSDQTRLYVMSSGLASGLWPETVLYEYDLIVRKTLRQVEVDARALPSKCPIGVKP